MTGPPGPLQSVTALEAALDDARRQIEAAVQVEQWMSEYS
jgi:hypothetical protein